MQAVDEGHIQKESGEFLTAMKILETSPKWKVKEEKTVSVWEMDVDGRTAIKASITINVPMERVVECFRTPKFMRSLNENMVKSDIPYEKGNLKVIHLVVKMPGPVSNR